MMHSLRVKNPLYPLVCILSSLVIAVVGLIMVKGHMTPFLILFLCVADCCFGLYKTTFKCLLIFIPVSAIFGVFTYLFNWNLLEAVQMAERVLLLAVAAIPAVCMPPINLTRCLTKLRCPRMITLGMLIVIRFVPVLKAEVSRIREAMKTRGVNASLWNFSCFYRALLIPLMMRLINISDTLSLSLETRGFELGKAPSTIYRDVRFRPRDAVYSALVAAMLIGTVVFA